MSIAAMTAVWNNSKQKGSELLTLLAIADHAKDDGTGAYPSIDTLAHKTRLSERQTRYIVRSLEEAGELKVRLNAGPNGVNVYDIVLPGIPDIGGAKIAPGQKLPGAIQRRRRGQPIAPDPSVDPSIKTNPPPTPPHAGGLPVAGKRAKRLSTLSPEDLLRIWNAHKSDRQARAEALSRARLTSAPQRLDEVARYLQAHPGVFDSEEAFWTECTRRLAASPWHNGENDRHWTADFDFLLRGKTWVRFIENRTATPAPGPAPAKADPRTGRTGALSAEARQAWDERMKAITARRDTDAADLLDTPSNPTPAVAVPDLSGMRDGESGPMGEPRAVSTR